MHLMADTGRCVLNWKLLSWSYCAEQEVIVCDEILPIEITFNIITHADESRGSKAFIRVCLCVSVSVCPHDRTKMTETTITKLSTGI